ncbi:hypothetical protein [Fervidicoccus fontis]|uniref:Uncharacterized protein n=1 Tax=Fervidicoccus fontis TaxID=683846 RepID=A0A7C2VN14_9CREN|nr:hypothetical protein [Fervidicoccus fontis]HEW63581.1 hypothetical protein [Fervidicoccus fontis]
MRLLNKRLVIETDSLEEIPEKVEVLAKDEYAVYSLDAAWSDVEKDVNKVKEKLKQFYLDDLIDDLMEFGFSSFQLYIKNHAVTYEIEITGIRSGKKGDILETLKIDEKIRGHDFCDIRHFETYKDWTQITIVCEVKPV